MDIRKRATATLSAFGVTIAAFSFVWGPQLATAQDSFAMYQLEIYCDDSRVARAIFNTKGTGIMGTRQICAGRCSGETISLKDALAKADAPASVARALTSQVEAREQQASTGAVNSLAGCFAKKEDPPRSKCDSKKACEAIEAMEKLIAKYDGTILGTLPGSLGEMIAGLNKAMQQLSEALACRFNEGHDASDARILNSFIGQLMRDKNDLGSVNSEGKLPAQISCDSDLGIPGSMECRDYQTLQRIRKNLSTFAGLLGCAGPPQGGTPAKEDCKELSNGLLDGLTTLFDELDKLKPKKQFGSGDAYDQVADGIDGALKELEAAAKDIEGTGGTGSQQYKDLQGKIGKLKKLLDVWGKMKAASCLPKEIEQLLRRLATEKRAGTEHKATCTELCGATADWYVKITGLSPQRGTFFKACTLACF